jgi:hypothetical protein
MVDAPDYKSHVIVVLCIVVLLLLLFIGYQALRMSFIAQQQSLYNQGVQQGQLLEQRNIVTSIINAG